MNTKNKKSAGFTVLEIIVASSILLVAVGLTLNFVVENFKLGMESEGKNMGNYNARKLTQEFMKHGMNATYFRLYDGFKSAERGDANDRLFNSNAGDFVAFVYLSPLDASNPAKRPIEKIVGFYRDTTGGDDPATALMIKKFEVEFSPASTAEVETLIPAEVTASGHRVIAEKTRGLADDRLFYNFWNKSVMVNGAMDFGNESKKSSVAYNLTITPRG